MSSAWLQCPIPIVVSNALNSRPAASLSAQFHFAAAELAKTGVQIVIAGMAIGALACVSLFFRILILVFGHQLGADNASGDGDNGITANHGQGGDKLTQGVWGEISP